MSTFNTLLKTTFTPIALCLTLAIAAPVIAKKGHNQKHDGMRQIFSELSLTDTQKQDIKLTLKDSRQNNKVLSSDSQLLREELRELIQFSEWDETTIASTLTQLHTLKQEIALQRALNKNQIWNTLTDTQQAELVVLLDTRKADSKDNSSKGKRRKKGKMFKSLNLNEEQLTAIKAIKAKSKRSHEAVKPNIIMYKQASQALIQSTTFDTDAWQALGAQYQADFLTLADLQAKTKHEIWNLLTSEQQSKLMAKMTKKSHRKNKKAHKKGKNHRQKKNA